MRLTTRRLAAWLWLAASLAAPAAHAADQMVVMVLYFDNNTANRDYDVLQKGLADMLVTDLSSVDALQVVERQKLQKLLEELKLQRSKYFDPSTAQKLGRGVGARYAVTGAFAAFDPQLRIDLRLVDVASAKVLMADKVVGAKERFFELQEQLVRKFVAGLNVKLSEAPRSGVGDVDTLLKYSRGVDSADKGDLQTASRQLAEVVRDAPDFALAKERYTEILRKLREAAKKREGLLGSDEELLLKNIDANLAGRDIATLPEPEAERYFGYRICRGNYFLWKVQQALGPPNTPTGITLVGPEKAAQALPHQRSYWDNTRLFISEMRRRHGRLGEKWRFDSGLSPEDEKRATELGIGDDCGEWSFAGAPSVARELAEFAVLGKTPFFGDLRFELRPTLIQSDPKLLAQVFAMLEEAKKEVPAWNGESLRVREAVRVIDAHGEALVFLGRKEEAIAQWQLVLDTFPTATEYKDVEKKIEDLLGVSKDAEAFAKHLEACSMEALSKLHEEGTRARRADGAKGLRRLVSQVEAACQSQQLAMGGRLSAYSTAAQGALQLGDCALYGEMRDRAEKTWKGGAASLDQGTTACR